MNKNGNSKLKQIKKHDVISVLLVGVVMTQIPTKAIVFPNPPAKEIQAMELDDNTRKELEQITRDMEAKLMKEEGAVDFTESTKLGERNINALSQEEVEEIYEQEMLIYNYKTMLKNADFINKNFKKEKVELTDSAEPTKIVLKEGIFKNDDLTGLLEFPIKVINGRSSIAVRDLETIFADILINWHDDVRGVSIIDKSDGGIVAYYPIDIKSKLMGIDIVDLDAPATIDKSNGRVYLPVRDLFETVGFKVDYNEKTNTIIIEEEK